MKWNCFWWLVLSHHITYTFPSCGSNRGDSDDKCKCSSQFRTTCNGKQKPSNRPCTRDLSETKCYMKHIDGILGSKNNHDFKNALKNLEDVLEETNVTETTSISTNHLVALLYKPKGSFTGLEIHANGKEAMPNKAVTNSKVNVSLPKELDAGPNNTIVFCMVSWNETNGIVSNQTGVVYESRLVGVSVSGKNVSGLQQRVNITMNITTVINKTEEPRCVFYNFSTQKFSNDGCLTLWKRHQSFITCSCDHLTYFGVLMVNAPDLSSEDKLILTYITLIGCSLSLFGLVITLLLFFTNRKIRTDVSMRVHISLAMALILLNVHFIISQQAAALLSTRPCFYIALALHYSLLATFTWMALEGFHLYLLLVRVFNIYIRRYLLKLSVVGWGVPAVIVSLVVIIHNKAYGHVPLNPSNSNDTTVCYITDDTVKIVTTVGVFGLVFIFNMIMLVVTVKRLLSLRQDNEFDKSNYGRVTRDIFTLLGISTLLGITWGLVFFSFGSLTTPVLYLFCILNSLQGFFIFLWFVLSLRKTGKSATKTSSETRSIS